MCQGQVHAVCVCMTVQYRDNGALHLTTTVHTAAPDSSHTPQHDSYRYVDSVRRIFQISTTTGTPSAQERSKTL